MTIPISFAMFSSNCQNNIRIPFAHKGEQVWPQASGYQPATYLLKNTSVAQSFAALEYTDSISTFRQDPPPHQTNEYPRYDTKPFDDEAPVL